MTQKWLYFLVEYREGMLCFPFLFKIFYLLMVKGNAQRYLAQGPRPGAVLL